jgi:hypothetical protein
VRGERGVAGEPDGAGLGDVGARDCGGVAAVGDRERRQDATGDLQPGADPDRVPERDEEGVRVVVDASPSTARDRLGGGAARAGRPQVQGRPAPADGARATTT